MELAIELAKKGEGKVNLNPMVGALIVKKGTIIGELDVIKGIKKGTISSKLLIKANKVLENTKVGDSICTNGVCLTVTDLKTNSFEADWKTVGGRKRKYYYSIYVG